MPSGGCTVTPGYNLGPGEKVNNVKLNEGFQPVVRVDAGAISDRELDSATNDSIAQSQLIGLPNLFCNGDFRNWVGDDIAFNQPLTSVLYGGALKHATGLGPTFGSGPSHWVSPNDAHREISRMNFPIGQTDVPDHPYYYVHYNQTAAISGIDPAYFAQRVEDVNLLSGRTVTFTIWARAATGFSVTPAIRQYFGGSGASPDVVVTGTPVALSGGVWTKITQVFNVPSVSGQIIVPPGPTAYTGSWTEFRIVVPQGISFQIDFAHAKLEFGDRATAWDPGSRIEDYLTCARYCQILGFYLLSNVTGFLPFVNLRAPTFHDPSSLGGNLYYVAAAGTGATLQFNATYKYVIYQNSAHSVNSPAYIVVDSETHAPV